MSVDHIGMWRRRGALVALAGGLEFPWLGAGLPRISRPSAPGAESAA